MPVALLESRNSPVSLNLSIVVEARYVSPVARKFPLIKADPVVVLLTEVNPMKSPLVAEKLVVKKLVELLLVANRFVIVALVVVEFPTIRLVMDASVATREEKNPLVLVELVEKRLVAVRAEAEAVLRVVWLETVRDVADAEVRLVCAVAVRVPVLIAAAVRPPVADALVRVV